MRAVLGVTFGIRNQGHPLVKLPNDRLGVAIWVRNFGDEPARKVRIAAAVKLVASDTADFTDYDAPAASARPAQLCMADENWFLQYIVESEAPATTEELAVARAEQLPGTTARLCCFGRIQYADLAGVEHFTDFAAFWDPAAQYRWTAAPSHNDIGDLEPPLPSIERAP